MRILHVVARSQRRGAETAALELAAELDRRGHGDPIVALRAAFDDSGLAELPVLGPEGSARALARALRLRRRVRREEADLVLVHGGEAAAAAALGLVGTGVPIVWQRILDLPDTLWSSRFRRAWWRWVDGRCAAVVALTEDLADEQRRLGRRNGLAVIPNFRAAARFTSVDHASAAARLRAELAVPADVALIGLVGHLTRQKRPERAVAVLDELRRRGTPVHLVVAGTGPDASDLSQRLDDADLAAHASLLGRRDDVADLLGALDLLLLVSEAEGVPGVLIEAQMAGCPVVTLAVGGVAEVVEHERTGLVVEDTAGVADAVAALLDDPDRLARMRTASRDHARRFDVAVVAERYEAVFGEVLDGSPG